MRLKRRIGKTHGDARDPQHDFCQFLPAGFKFARISLLVGCARQGRPNVACGCFERLHHPLSPCEIALQECRADLFGRANLVFNEALELLKEELGIAEEPDAVIRARKYNFLSWVPKFRYESLAPKCDFLIWVPKTISWPAAGPWWIYRFFAAPAEGIGRNGLRIEDRPALLLLAGSSRRSGCVPAELSSAEAKGGFPVSVPLGVYRAGNGKRPFELVASGVPHDYALVE